MRQKRQTGREKERQNESMRIPLKYSPLFNTGTTEERSESEVRTLTMAHVPESDIGHLSGREDGITLSPVI